MTHPYTNQTPPPQSMLLEPRMMPLSKKTELLEKCKFIIDFQLVEQAMIEAHLERHKVAWNIIYPPRTPYTPPEDFIKHLDTIKKNITEFQYRYTVIEMFM